MKEIIDEFLKSIILKQVEGSVYLVPAITDVMITELKASLKAEHELHPAVYPSDQIPNVQGDMVGIHYTKGGYGHGNYHTGIERWCINGGQNLPIVEEFTWSQIRKY